MSTDNETVNGKVFIFDPSRTRLRKGTIVQAMVDTSEYECGELGVVLDTEREEARQGSTYWVLFEHRYVSVISHDDLQEKTKVIHGTGINGLGEYTYDSFEQVLADLKSGLLRKIFNASIETAV